MRDHRKLSAFQLTDQLALAIYQATERFPRSEQFGLAAQMRRAAVSAVTNIVEGAARETQRDFVKFLTIAFGSLRELGYLCDLSRRLGFLSETDFSKLQALQDRAAGTLVGLIRSLREE